MKRIFAIFMCIAIYGCDPRYNATEENPYEKWSEWTDGQLVSIINDSLAILKIVKYRTETWYDWGFEGSKEYSKIIDSRTGLFLVNYRNKQKPLLGDTLAYDLIVANEYHRDSSVLVFDKKSSKFGFWKIGAKSIEFNNYSDLENCDFSYASVKAKPWIDGNILLIRESCPLSILNATTDQIEPFVFSEEYEWLSSCNHMSYIGGKIACIKGNNSADYFELIVDAIVTDTLAYEYARWHGIKKWYGNYLKDNRYGSGNKGGEGEISKIDTLNFRFDNTFRPIRVDDNTNGGECVFNDSGNYIYYYAKNLVGAGN
jgi:hypothetical protein